VRAAYARQQDIDAGHPKWPEYTDVWGIAVAIDHVFTILSEERESNWNLADAQLRQQAAREAVRAAAGAPTTAPTAPSASRTQ
jgi:hypothetical protein